MSSPPLSCHASAVLAARGVAISSVVAVVLATCGGATAWPIEHPQSENLLLPEEPRSLIRAVGATVPGVYSRLLDPDAADAQTVRIGQLAGEPEHVIGFIQDLGVTRDGRIAVLDARYNTVRIFGVDGAPLGTVGRPGQGPGEISIAKALELTATDDILVADERRQILVYRRVAGDWTYARAMDIPLHIHDFCIMGDTLVVLGVSETRTEVLHAYLMDGTHAASWGTPYRTSDPFIRFVTSEGRILCFPDQTLIVLALTRLPEVHGYGLDGTVRWIARYEQYEPMHILEGGDGSVQLGLGSDRTAMQMLIGAAAAPDSHAIVQLGRYTRRDVEQHRTFSARSTYLIDTRSGEGGAIEWGLGTIGFLASRMVVTHEEDPYPRIVLRVQLD